MEIDRMFEMGDIKPAETKWGAPIVFVPKKDGSSRFCMDYRKLNAVITIRDSYTIPKMDECIVSLVTH